MYRKAWIIAAGCLLLAQQAGAGAKDIVWDIGREPHVTVPREPGEYRLIVIGWVQKANYTTSITVETLAVAPFPQPSEVPALATAAQPTPSPSPGAVEDPCLAYYQNLAGLLNTAVGKFVSPDLSKGTAEADFSDARDEARAALESPEAGCAVPAAAWAVYNQLVKRNRWVLGTVPVNRGQTLKASFARSIGDNELKFSYESSTGKRGTWLASYGFGITPNNDEHYFSKANDNDTFDITREHDNGGLNPTAAVFYTWLPSKRETSDWNWGIAGGIGIDQTNLVLFLGPHITFNQNLGLVAGIALHQETRLAGEYEEGQTVTEALTGSSLEEKIMRTSWFVGLTLRFGAPEK